MAWICPASSSLLHRLYAQIHTMYLKFSMREPEIKPFRTLVLSRLHIVNLLLPGQLRPSHLAALIPRYIVELDQIEQNDVEAADRQQDLVATDIERPVIFAVDICADDVAGLHEHVVQSCRYCPRSDGVAVSGVPGDEDGVAVRIR